MNLRQRIRQTKICCKPWKQYRGEIKLLPISAQCLFSNDGLPWDILEVELKSEAWLQENEVLWEVISTEQGLKRTLTGECDDEYPFDDAWTEDDYINFYNDLDKAYF